MAGMCFAGMEGWDCALLWLSMVMIFFITAVFRRQVAMNLLEMNFNIIIGVAGGEIIFIVALYIMGVKIAFILGLVGAIILGFVGGPFFGGGGGEEGW